KNYGVGACLLQEDHPLYYASQTLSAAQQKWAQIEKELYSILFRLERFHSYTYGRQVLVHNNHKPLQSILKKPLDQVPKQLQSIMLRILVYNVSLEYHPRSEMLLADLLSRAPLADKY